MPLVPIVMPSQIATESNSIGVPPAAGHGRLEPSALGPVGAGVVALVGGGVAAGPASGPALGGLVRVRQALALARLRRGASRSRWTCRRSIWRPGRYVGLR